MSSFQLLARLRFPVVFQGCVLELSDQSIRDWGSKRCFCCLMILEVVQSGAYWHWNFGSLILPFKSYLFFFYVYEHLPACVNVYCVDAWCPWRSEEDDRYPGTRITDSRKPPSSGCYEMNHEFRQEQWVLLTDGPSSQSSGWPPLSSTRGDNFQASFPALMVILGLQVHYPVGSLCLCLHTHDWLSICPVSVFFCLSVFFSVSFFLSVCLSLFFNLVNTDIYFS